MTRYQALAVTTVGATLVLIAIGAVVRTTGSGLGCPDWPLCHGQLLPPAERTAIIEYTHRTAAAIVGLLIVATAAVALLRHRGACSGYRHGCAPCSASWRRSRSASPSRRPRSGPDRTRLRARDLLHARRPAQRVARLSGTMDKASPAHGSSE